MTTDKLFQIISNDPFANYMGITLEKLEPGYARLSMTVTEKMLNFHGVTHGGAVFAIADAAFAAASNSHGQASVALNMNITYLAATRPGQKLIATGREERITRKTGAYRITVETSDGELIAVAEGIVYRKDALVPGLDQS